MTASTPRAPGGRRTTRVVPAMLRVIIGLIIVAVVAVYGVSGRELSRKYPVEPATLDIPEDPASVERGRHLAMAVLNCTVCHGDDLGGKVYAEAGPLGIIVGPNLTRGRGGIGDDLTSIDYVRAIRHGVRRDSTSLIVMPSETYVHLSDADLASVIAYVKQLPPVDREPGRTHFRFLGRTFLALGKLPILVAPKTPPYVPVSATAGETAEYGRYLADVSGCRGCHGFGLSGGRVAGPDDLPPASNLTPDEATGMGKWTEADFVRALREGRRPNGTAINQFMPWRTLGRMTDEELRAIWLYLRSVPAKPFGSK